ncbi:LacI family DNA-binding transcriptional regulator [Clostridium saccharoperbutylacetonicum]|uniref:LacI family DNA-binding transcriptional regulator n=1 Tax=Clostridium saccharoperbutylacetonicum TaxID=36745 RepID=UPI00156F3478|nr:LacI family DNA-binding transcriptional regulator [Clostridium saccharoperbutylacetonicum]NSB33482.1 DNA-binding LacI/PurR family transcriptional regulator [Clostridium saccharoperbutylacetonicum]
MKVTINDIAHAANVSKSTVSKFINNHKSISESTKLKVRNIMKELNYIPNNSARQLARQNSFNIGLLVDISRKEYFLDFFFYNIIGGVESIVGINNYELTLSNINSLECKAEFLNRLIYSKKVDGIIIPTSIVNSEIISKLNGLNFPYVLIGQPKEFKNSTSWVDVNNTVGGELATCHLIEQGYKNIAFIGGRSNEIISFNRLLGYKNILSKLNFTKNNLYIKEGNSDKESGYELTLQLLSDFPEIDAILCINNYVAFGVLKALKEKGLNSPTDIGIVTFDNEPFSAYTTPSLTCLDVDTFKLGEVAAEILMKKIQNPNSQNEITLISPKLLIRESSLLKKP